MTISKGNYQAEGCLNKQLYIDHPGRSKSSMWEGAVLTRILVVDDDVEMIEQLKIILEPKLFKVHAAHSGPEGIELARQLSLDVIILDLILPGMDGWQLCKEIRKFSQVPILVLSAVNTPGMVAQALDSGADDYLTKPMHMGILTAHLKKLIRRARAEQGASKTKLDYCL
jgi:two-component system KDP operon response regulator KdpE